MVPNIKTIGTLAIDTPSLLTFYIRGINFRCILSLIVFSSISVRGIVETLVLEAVTPHSGREWVLWVKGFFVPVWKARSLF